MTPRFLFRPAARAELLEARDWYESQRQGLGYEAVFHHRRDPRVWQVRAAE